MGEESTRRKGKRVGMGKRVGREKRVGLGKRVQGERGEGGEVCNYTPSYCGNCFLCMCNTLVSVDIGEC